MMSPVLLPADMRRCVQSGYRQLCLGSFLVFSMAAGVQNASAKGVERYSDPKDDFPISAAVQVPAGAETVYVSGLGPAPGRAVGMTTAEQTQSALDQISAALGHFGMTLQDVVQMHVYLVADPRLGRMDFDGMMQAYRARFRSGFPARTVIEVPHLTNPHWLVEIDVVASKNDVNKKRFPAK